MITSLSSFPPIECWVWAVCLKLSPNARGTPLRNRICLTGCCIMLTLKRERSWRMIISDTMSVIYIALFVGFPNSLNSSWLSWSPVTKLPLVSNLANHWHSLVVSPISLQNSISVGTLTFALYHIVKNPEVLRKLREEVDEVLGDETITQNDMGRLKYNLGL